MAMVMMITPKRGWTEGPCSPRTVTKAIAVVRTMIRMKMTKTKMTRKRKNRMSMESGPSLMVA
jgi:hypothetical protein